MIHITGNYYVKVTPYGYNLVYDTGKEAKRKDPETGDETMKKVYDAISYHGTFADAIRGAARDMQRKKLIDAECSLSDALCLIEEVHNKFEEILRETVIRKEEI